MKIKSAVITAAGFGSRFLPFVKNIPKEMLPLIDKPSIQLLVEECVEVGIENIIIVVREGNTVIKDHFTKLADDVYELLESQGKLDRFTPVQKVLDMKGVKIINQLKDLPYGNGSPVYSAKPYLPEGEPFALMFGDDMFLSNTDRGGLGQIIDYYNKFEEGTCNGVIAGMTLPISDIVGKYGNVKFRQYDKEAGEGIIETQIEKPKLEEVTSDAVTYGRMVLSYDVFQYIKPTGIGLDNELWVMDAVKKLAENGEFRFKIPSGLWITTGDPERYFHAVIQYYLNDKKYGPKALEYLKGLNLK
jgi:UTP--glucose-1-phosphate uridylyltransferase